MLIMKAVSPANSLASVAVLFCLFISGGNGRPYEEQASPISEDTSSRYEVYIPDGTGEMAQQLLTLPEIRTLLARQADDEEVQSVPYNENRANIVSLEGGKRLVETVPLPDAYASRIGVSDVVSSVRSIMASEMAQHEQQQNKVHVVQAETSPEEENDATPSEESQTDVVMTDVAAPEATEESLEATPVESAMEEAAVRQDNHLHEEHHGEHHGDHHGDHHGEHHEHHGDHHGEHHEHHDEHHHHHEHHHPAAVFEPLPKESVGLLATSSAQDQELTDLTSSSNKIAWQVWSNSVKEQSIENNQVFSPLALTSALGISFLGARGTSAEAIDTVLGLDRFKSRNPHLHLQQVAKDVDIGEHFQSTQAHTVFVDEKKGAVQDIFRARLDTLYGAATTSNLSHVQRMVSSEYPVRQQDDVDLRAPFGIISTANLNVAWPSLTVPADQQEEYLQFLNLPSSAQVAAGRKLVSVPTIRTAGHFYAGYNNELDATTVAIPLHPVRDGEATTWAPSDALDQAGHLSLVLVMPGSASKFQAGGSGLADLESRLASQEDGWDHLLRQTKPYHLLVEMPKLSDTNRLNLTSALKSADSGRLATIFDPRKADFSGISSAKPLYLSDVIQLARLNISSVASLTGDEPTGRSTDAKKKTAVAGKQGTKAKPSKVQVTVKSPCKEAIEAAVAAAMDAHIKKTQKATAKPAVAAQKKPAAKPASNTQAKPANKPQTRPAVQPKPATKPQTRPAAQPKPASSKPQTKPTVQKTSQKPSEKKPAAKPNSPANAKPVQTKTTPKPAGAKTTKRPMPKTTVKPKPASASQVATVGAKRPATTKAPVKPASVQQKSTARPKTTVRPKTTARPKTSVRPKTTFRPKTTANPKTTVRPKPKTTVRPKTTSRPKPKTTTRPRPKTTVKSQAANKPTTKKPATVTNKPSVAKKPAVTTKVAVKATPKPTVRPKTTPKTSFTPCPLHNRGGNPSDNKQTPAKTSTKSTAVKKGSGNDGTGKKTRTERQTTEDKLQHISFNRAFTYAVRHNPTGLLLMIGRYVHPEE